MWNYKPFAISFEFLNYSAMAFYELTEKLINKFKCECFLGYMVEQALKQMFMAGYCYVAAFAENNTILHLINERGEVGFAFYVMGVYIAGAPT